MSGRTGGLLRKKTQWGFLLTFSFFLFLLPKLFESVMSGRTRGLLRKKSQSGFLLTFSFFLFLLPKLFERQVCMSRGFGGIMEVTKLEGPVGC